MRPCERSAIDRQQMQPTLSGGDLTHMNHYGIVCGTNPGLIGIQIAGVLRIELYIRLPIRALCSHHCGQTNETSVCHHIHDNRSRGYYKLSGLERLKAPHIR